MEDVAVIVLLFEEDEIELEMEQPRIPPIEAERIVV